ncbi:MAG: nucleoside recognition domain-containing protein [Desulfocapsaceae bacterium]
MSPALLQARIIAELKDLGRDCFTTSLELLKVTIPALIFTKILEELGLVAHIGNVLDPVMGLMGLPGELGLVWATAILTTPYSAIGVFAALAPSLQLSGAEMTILGSVMLIAHSLPVEVSITRKAGAPVIAISLIRLLGALGYGVILHQLCTIFSIWQEPAVMLFQVAVQERTLLQWGVTQGRNICLIIVVIFFVLLAMRLLKALGFLALLERLLNPVLPVFGMSHRAAPVTVVGMILGIAYGGALIIKETTAGKMERREVFNSLALMSLSHGLVEDTLVMLAIGAKLGGILWGRLLFSLVVVFLLVRIIDMFSGKTATQTSSNN